MLAETSSCKFYIESHKFYNGFTQVGSSPVHIWFNSKEPNGRLPPSVETLLSVLGDRAAPPARHLQPPLRGGDGCHWHLHPPEEEGQRREPEVLVLVAARAEAPP